MKALLDQAKVRAIGVINISVKSHAQGIACQPRSRWLRQRDFWNFLFSWKMSLVIKKESAVGPLLTPFSLCGH
jgi:hypothetical protein